MDNQEDRIPIQVQLTQAQQIQRTMTMVEQMHDRLFVDGDGGVIKGMQNDIDSLKETRSHGKGAFSVMSVALGIAGWPHIRDLFK